MSNKVRNVPKNKDEKKACIIAQLDPNWKRYDITINNTLLQKSGVLVTTPEMAFAISKYKGFVIGAPTGSVMGVFEDNSAKLKRSFHTRVFHIKCSTGIIEDIVKAVEELLKRKCGEKYVEMFYNEVEDK